MNNIFKRKKIDVFLKIAPLFMFKISLWCIYIILKGTQDEISLAGIIALNVIFLFFIYTTVYKNNPTTILFEREYLQLTDLLKLKPKKVLWNDIYNITIVMHSKKTSFLKIFYVVDQDYLAYEVSLSNFSEVEKIIRLLRIISEDKNYTFTEILVKELGELGDKKIVDKIDFCSIGAKANRRNQVFNIYQNKFNMFGNILPLLFLLFCFYIFMKISLGFAICYMLIASVSIVIHYRYGYNLFDSILLGMLTLPTIGLMFVGPIMLIVGIFLNN